MQAAASQIAKAKVSLKLLQTVSNGIATFGALANELEFGKAMAEVNRMAGFEDDEAAAILERSAKAATAGLDEEDE